MSTPWPTTTLIVASVCAFLLTAALTGLLRWHALKRQWLDIPNARSSHAVATPRGGGVAFVITLLLVTMAFVAWDVASVTLATAVLPTVALVATCGFIDDRVSLPALWRFAAHAIAAVWALAWIDPLPAVPVLGYSVDLGLFGLAGCWLFIVWMINLFNFMDGIDGLASCEAITVAGCGAFLWACAGQGSDWMLAVVFACSVAGFLAWNFPPAKIFMGDAGSGCLGLVVAVFALWCGQKEPALFWSWFILVGCFMVDAATTLVRRARRGERVHVAHRLHAYQYASRRLGSHLTVTLALTGINLVWLFPLAALVAFGHLDGVLGVAIAYLPLIALAFHYKAGDRAAQGE